jgi:hypothetical protein
VANKRAAGRKNSAAFDSKANVDFSAMAARGRGDHEPTPLVGCDRSRGGAENHASGQQSEGYAIGDHGFPHSKALAAITSAANS